MPPERIKLLQFITDFRVGGTERQVATLARAIDSARFDLRMACLRRSGEFLRDVERCGIPVEEYRVNSLYNLKSLSRRLKLASRIRRERIQVVHTYGFYPNVFAVPAARVAGTPVVVASIRDTGEMWNPLQKRVQRMACRLADAVLVNAEAVRQRLVSEGYEPQKIRVIRNGLDLSRFPGKPGNGRLRRELGLPPHVPLVAVLCRLYQVNGIELKGVEYFLEAAESLAGRFPEARFLVVGDGGGREELERRAAELGLGDRLRFTGFRLDVPEVLSEISVSVLPSLSEALSNSLLESMAAGVPVVATRVGGNPEVIQEGRTGLLVPPRDAPALARAIARLLKDPFLAVTLGRAGRRRVAECFSVDRMTRETEHLYRDLLERSRRSWSEGCMALWREVPAPQIRSGLALEGNPGERSPMGLDPVHRTR